MLLAVGVGAGTLALVAVGGWAWASLSVAEPTFETVVADGDFELRAYPALVVAETAKPGDRGQAVRAGFSPLAGYIFARGRPGDKIAMTAPVTQRRDGAGWTVQFVMPEGRTLADLPPPAGPEVRLAEWPAARRAAVRFSGVADDASIADAEARLRAWMAARGLTDAGEPPLYAYYNDPLTPGFLRRNEVLVTTE
jgi:hypothetical protein